MELPFSRAAFFSVFERYNERIWPLQMILFALAVIIIFSIFRKTVYRQIVIFSMLSFLWIWMGVVYHLLFFSQINKAAYIFGILFIAQGLIFLYYGAYRKKMKVEYTRGYASILGGILILYSLVFYPLLGLVSGQYYPAAPTFGAPCPTTIFTFGVLLFSEYRIRWYMVIIPFLWSLIGFSAAVSLSVSEDFGLVIAGVVSTVIVVFYKPRHVMQPGMAL